jgi:hypothetical protein
MMSRPRKLSYTAFAPNQLSGNLQYEAAATENKVRPYRGWQIAYVRSARYLSLVNTIICKS